MLAITCIWRLHWSVRRGSWSRVVRRGVDFIPLKFLWSTELPCARGRGLIWRGAGGRVPYCLRVIPRVYPGSKWRIFRRASCMQTPDGLPMARSTLLGIAGGERASISPPAPLVFVGLTDLLAYRVPYIRPARLVYLVGRVRRGAGLPLPGARHLRSTLYTRRPFRLPSLRAPTVPGANVIGPGALHARPPEVAQESTHRLFTGSRRARGCCASRPAAVLVFRSFVVCGAAWGGAPPSRLPPGAEHRCTSFLPSPHWSQSLKNLSLYR